MKKNILTFGLIAGTILCLNMIYMVNLCYTRPDLKSNDILGYAAMIVVFSMIFFGVRNYRDKELSGIITFGNAFKTGVLIALVGSLVYVVVWLFYYYLFVPDYLEIYITHVLNEIPANELEAKTIEMNDFREMYKNPIMVILITFSEVFPVGLVVSFICAFMLERKSI